MPTKNKLIFKGLVKPLNTFNIYSRWHCVNNRLKAEFQSD